MATVIFNGLAYAQVLLWIVLTTGFYLFFRRFQSIGDEPTQGGEADRSWPRVRIVVAARNEARDIEEAITSMAVLRYPNFEIVAVDDRSTDATGEILEKLSRRYSNIKVLHVQTLPSGWLGKNHALFMGARDAASDWLLFTDADVRFHPDVLRKAIAFSESKGFDHMAVFPTLFPSGPLLNSVYAVFMFWFGLLTRPFDVPNPRSSAFVGVGAFNLVRRNAYQSVGGYQTIALRPDDDIKLGKILKRSGFRQIGIMGGGMIRLYWYRSVREMAVGFEKNIFAVMEYSLARFAVLLVLYGLILIVPFMNLFLSVGGANRLAWITVVWIITLLVISARKSIPAPRWTFVFLPVAIVLVLGMIIRSVALTLWRRGIVWRDQFYPLKELRKSRV